MPRPVFILRMVAIQMLNERAKEGILSIGGSAILTFFIFFPISLFVEKRLAMRVSEEEMALSGRSLHRG
jgi:hypothetical protein